MGNDNTGSTRSDLLTRRDCKRRKFGLRHLQCFRCCKVEPPKPTVFHGAADPKHRIFRLILIRGDQRYRSLHLNVYRPHPQEAPNFPWWV